MENYRGSFPVSLHNHLILGPLSDDVQRLRTVAPSIFFSEMMPLYKFRYGNCVHSKL